MELYPNIIGFGISVVALWHVAGFAFGLVYVWQSTRSLLGHIFYDSSWNKILKGADYHLWLSGIALIMLGILNKGVEIYLYNPKLWCKVTVVIAWFIVTQAMRHFAVPQMKKGNNKPMMHLSAISVSCWIYGAFLGCAKPLGGGAVSYPVFLLGFLGLTLIVMVMMKKLSVKSSSL